MAPKPEVKVFIVLNFIPAKKKNMTKEKKHRAQNVAKCTRAAL